MKVCVKKIKVLKRMDITGDCALCSHYKDFFDCDIDDVEEKSELYWLGYGLKRDDAFNAACAFWQYKTLNTDKTDCIKPAMTKTSEKTEADNEWDKLWNDIYEFQRTLSIDSLPSDEKELEKMGLYIVSGKNAEKLFMNKELSTRLFLFRCSQ